MAVIGYQYSEHNKILTQMADHICSSKDIGTEFESVRARNKFM